ncbi:DNA/RNA non-specific endonuclease [Streptomyces sp. NPDC090442]|uniref:DNA/RNA non-specific endonuclease n=1 Tax=Streptomyces sp. NPDC090442 TaxID=3365962 RepID=UPI0037F9DA2E
MTGSSSPSFHSCPRRHLRRILAVFGAAGVVTTLLSVPAATAAPSVKADYPCERYLKAWAGKTVVSRWKFHIDANGRPDRAIADSLSAGTSPRSQCETTVGGWGGGGYDGGHLIASTLKGVSKRINLVPMKASINRGIYKKVEGAAKKCLSTLGKKDKISYNVSVGYPDPKSVVPRDMTVAMTVKKGTGKKDFKLTIPNQNISPQKEAALKKQLNNGLKAAGCPTV